MFNNSTNGYSLSDIAAAAGVNNGNDGFGNSGGAWWIFLLVILFFGFGWGGGYGGYGGGNGSGTPQIASSMNTDYLSGSIRDLQSGLTNSFQILNNELLNGFCDNRSAFAQNTADIIAATTNGFNTQNLANLQNTNAIQRDIYAGTVGAMQNTQLLQSTLAQMSSDNRADTAQLQYNMATDACAMNTANANNTRDIIDALNAGNRAILDRMAQDKADAMQDRLNELQAENQRLAFAASQAAQTNDIVNTIRPLPTPSYSVQNPWAGCNCGNYNAYNNMVNV